MKICCVFSLESPHQGDFQYKKKITLNHPKTAAAMGFFLESQERVQNSHCKQAISVRATEVLL